MSKSNWLDSDSFFNQAESLFRDIFSETFDNPTNVAPKLFERASYPKLDIIEREGELVINVEIPGLSKDDVQIEYNSDRILIIRGEKRETSGNKNEFYIRRELKKSSFSRQICKLGENCDVKNIKATFKDGMLQITIPKKIQNKPAENTKIKID